MRSAPAEILIDDVCKDISPLLQREFGAHRVACVDVHKVVRERAAEVVAAACVMILGGRARDGTPLPALARCVRDYLQHVGIFAVVPFVMEEHGRLRAYARAGVDRVFALSSAHKDDRDLFVAELRARVFSPAPEAELAEVMELLPEREERALVLYCLRNGYRDLSVAEVARAFELPERTLRERLRRAKLPVCIDLIHAGRHLHLAHLSRRFPHWSREELAQRCHKASAAALRAARRRLVRSLVSQGPVGAQLAKLL